MSFEVQEVVNPFPSPPDRFKLFTDQNIRLLKLIRDRTATKEHQPLPEDTSAAEILEGEDTENAPEDMTVMEKPRLDWIIEGGRYEVYADIWKIEDGQPVVPPAKAVHYLVPTHAGDKRLSLHKMLKTILHTFYSLLGSIQEHIPVDDRISTPFEEDAMFMAEIAYSFMDTARETLEQLLVRQLEDRKQETRRINDRCDAMSASLAALRSQITAQQTSAALDGTENLFTEPSNGGGREVSEDDVLRWVNEVQ